MKIITLNNYESNKKYNEFNPEHCFEVKDLILGDIVIFLSNNAFRLDIDYCVSFVYCDFKEDEVFIFEEETCNELIVEFIENNKEVFNYVQSENI